MVASLLQRHIHTIFYTVLLIFTTVANPSLGIRYPETGNTEFIRNTCKATLYPTLCFSTLSIYAAAIQTSPKLLANTALSITLSAAQNTSSFMKKLSHSSEIGPREMGPMKDCLEVLGDALQELRDSIAEMGHIKNDQSFNFLMNNVQTWVSAALTDEDTCTDGFSEKSTNWKVKMMVNEKIDSIAQLTSNSLALINSYASHHV